MLLSVQDVACGYGDAVVLEGVSFDVQRGEVFAILGGSGCGKSTLLKHVIGLHPLRAGRIELGGEDFGGARGERRRQLLRRVGIAYQSGALFGAMTLEENARLPLEELSDLPPDAIAAMARMKLAAVGLDGFEGHYPSEISGGMKKRAALARALALDPDLVFLDEPSAGLDPVTSAELDVLIRRLVESTGVSFVIVTHELDSIAAIVDRAIFLDRSVRGPLAQGTLAELRASELAPVRAFFRREPLSAAPAPDELSPPASATTS